MQKGILENWLNALDESINGRINKRKIKIIILRTIEKDCFKKEKRDCVWKQEFN
jgi:hypothetical protein